MVVQELRDGEIDLLFHALADATRRDIVRRVIDEEQSVSTLAQKYDVTLAAVQKHIAVLERAALITKQRRGRQQIVHGNVSAIQKADQFLQQCELLWRQRGDRIASLLTEGQHALLPEGQHAGDPT